MQGGRYAELFLLQNASPALGFAFHPAYEVDHLATIGAMVAEQLGVAAIPAMAADVIGTAGIVRRALIDPMIRRSIGLVTRRDRAASPAAAAMLDLLKEQLGATNAAQPGAFDQGTRSTRS